MEQQDLNNVKMVVRSVLTSTPDNVTIGQLIKDYNNLEGSPIPYAQLGFKNVYELLKAMNDILTIPHNPTMMSTIRLIVDKKTSHLRNLVVNQKSKRSKNRNFKKSYNTHYGHTYYHDNFNNRDYNVHMSNNKYKNNYNIRGYDYIKHNPISLQKSKGIVTDELKICIENLCKNSEFQCVHLNVLKCHLINHPDYGKLKTNNIEDAINMLKYFIYIDKGGVYLKNFSYGIFPSNKSKANCGRKPSYIGFTQNIVKEDNAIGFTQNIIEEDNAIGFTQNIVEEDNAIGFTQNIVEEDKALDFTLKIEEDKVMSLMNTDLIYDNEFIQFKENEYDSKIINQQLQIINNNNTSEIIKKIELPEVHTTLNNKPVKYDNIQSENKLKTSDSIESNKDVNYYKGIISSIITNSCQPITVNQVLSKFKNLYGYNFPFLKLNCRTCMDFFRLYSTSFRLSDQYSTNSVITLEEEIVNQLQSTKRHIFIRANIFNNDNIHNDSVEHKNEIYLTSLLERSCLQPLKNCIDNIKIDTNCKEPNTSYEIYDSDTILESTKEKMRTILTKFENGISCNDFMNAYTKEYHSSFTFDEYGFKSMKDMAYKLPTVFYPKKTEDDIILYNAERRMELENNSNDPLEYYKKIPKTILHNLSVLFNNHQTGIPLNGLMKLYCVEFGRSYEPLKYGYSSERHMFESLNKMVEIRNDTLYTLDPFAYTDFLKNEYIIDNKKSLPVLPIDNLLMNYYGNDVCNGKFVYREFEYNNEKYLDITIGEIYGPNSFYILRSSAMNMLNNFMADLQEFYDKNDEIYKVLPELLTLGLACTSRFEDSKQWHRAKILNMVDESRVQLLYVDYGSVEVVLKSNVRLLYKKFSSLPVQSLHCTLIESKQLKHLSREMNEFFADMIDDKKLQALFHKRSPKYNPDITPITLYFQKNKSRLNLNKEFLNEIKKITPNKNTIRTTILKLDDLSESDDNELDETDDYERTVTKDYIKCYERKNDK